MGNFIPISRVSTSDKSTETTMIHETKKAEEGRTESELEPNVKPYVVEVPKIDSSLFKFLVMSTGSRLSKTTSVGLQRPTYTTSS